MAIIDQRDAAFFMIEYPRDRKARHFQFGQIGADRTADTTVFNCFSTVLLRRDCALSAGISGLVELGAASRLPCWWQLR